MVINKLDAHTVRMWDDMAKKSLSTQNNVSILYPGGFGFGTGPINVAQQLGTGALTYGALIVGAEVIENDSRVFKKTDPIAKDDGCGDGREAKVIYEVRDGQRIAHTQSLLRAKIFGGGLVVFGSMMRSSVWGADIADATVLGDREKAASLLKQHKVKHGGHTDNHASGDNCGCGAIDKYPDITTNALAFRSDIEQVLKLVFGEDYSLYEKAIEEVFAVYAGIVHDQYRYFADAAGVKTRELLEQSGAIIKELADDHMEDFVVINDVVGETFHQREFDTILRERGVPTTAQAFVVDMWRGRMYAQLVASEAAKLGQNKDTAFKKAMVDFLVRTLATAGTVTSGDQPVFYRTARMKNRRLFFLQKLSLRSRR